MWPGIAIGAFLANYLTGLPLPVSFGIAIGNTLEAVCGVVIVKRFSRRTQQLDSTLTAVSFDKPVTSVRGLGTFLAVIVFATMISATIGTCCLYISGLNHGFSFPYLWWTWWMGDTAGGIVFAPLILAWTDSEEKQWSVRKIIEGLALLLLIALLGFLVFSGLKRFGSSA